MLCQKVSFVIPAFNEERRISSCIKSVGHYILNLNKNIEFEVLIVVEKSTDKTLSVISDTLQSNPEYKKYFSVIANDVKRGKGYAVKTGMLKATGEITFFMDCDLSTSLDEVEEFLNVFDQQSDVDIIIGSRQHSKSKLIKKQNILRQKMGIIFNRLVQKMAMAGISDTQCGFKAFRKKCIQPIFKNQTIDGFAFDVEVLLLAQRFKYNIIERPVDWTNSEDSKVHIIKDSLSMLSDILRIKKSIDKRVI